MAKHILIIVSDLHLSAVQDTKSGQCVAYEGFHYDVAFSHFVDQLIERAKNEDACYELLLLGDFLDFLHTKVPLTESDFLVTTEASNLQKLEAIFQAHPLFFEALKRLVAAGFCLRIVPGNHDIGLMRPAVQRALKETIEASSNNIHFHSWIYYVPRVLYAEHGHQYHDITAYSTLLTPFRRGNENELELTITDYFDLYLFHLIERINPPAKNIDAPLRYLFNSYRNQPRMLIRTFPALYRFFFAVVRQFFYRSSRQFRRIRQRYQENILSGYAASLEFSQDTCVALDQLADLSNPKMVKRILRRALLKQAKGDPVKTGFHYPKALRISKVLRAANRAVPFYIFGHSHELAKVALNDQPDAFYLNSGTWASLSYPGFSGDRSLFPFVELAWENDGQPTATLMQWDETQQRTVRVGEA